MLQLFDVLFIAAV